MENPQLVLSLGFTLAFAGVALFFAIDLELQSHRAKAKAMARRALRKEGWEGF